MTANAMSEDRDECIKAGMDEYISKPVNIESLMNKLIDLNKIIAPDYPVARFEN